MDRGIPDVRSPGGNPANAEHEAANVAIVSQHGADRKLLAKTQAAGDRLRRIGEAKQ